MHFDRISASVEASGCGEHLAIVSDDASLTYTELLTNIEKFAEKLQASGVQPGNILLAYVENTPAFLVAMIACTKVGCTFAPLDVGLTDAEVENILTLTKSNLVACHVDDVERCQSFSDNIFSVDVSGIIRESNITELPTPSFDPDIACMQFSSGSTGAPKGILLNKEAFFYRSHYLQQTLDLNETDRTICTLPLSHTHGAECLSLPTLLGCGTLYLKSPKFSFPLYIIEELERLKITFFSSIPQFYDFAVKIENDKTPDLSHLRHPFCGSAALAKSTAETFYKKYGVHIKQGYGLAELSVICINMHESNNVVYDSIGKLIGDIECQPVDGEGELVVRSNAMFSGYINDEKNTREKLRDGWLYTGDIVTVDEDGLFRVVGRKEDFIKVNGFKVYAAEVEAEIIRLDWVRECAVLSEKDHVGTEKIIAHIVLTDGDAPQDGMEKDLVKYLRGRLSDYKLPRKVVVQKKFPKNPLGKILKSKIRKMSSGT